MNKCSIIFYYSLVALLIMVFLPSFTFAQLDADVSTTDNTNCYGNPCDYNGPSILINELMMSPESHDGSLWGGSFTQRGEWIELYNPNVCDEIDISCYYLGNNANDGGNHPGGYVIPPGTVVPPAGFALIRGVYADPVPSNLLVENGGNVVELIVFGANVCVGAGTRLWFPNSGGWFAFYDNNGVPQDAVSWATQANINQPPCVPDFTGCGYTGSLATYSQFPDDRKNYILNTSAADFQGESIRRIPDGGEWSGTDEPTYAVCNETCFDPFFTACNGTATVIPQGGTAPYSYLWDDMQSQTTQTADSLCAGEYCVLITDALNTTFQQCVTVLDVSYSVEFTTNICEGESYTLPDNSVATETGTYPIVLLTGNGCDSIITVDLEVFPSYEFVTNEQICSNQTYPLPDGTVASTTGIYDFTYQTVNGCDSIYTINLTVNSPIVVSIEAQICEGDVYQLPDGTEVTDEGLYEINVLGDSASCDTIFSVDLSFHPILQIDVDVINDVVCNGQANGYALLSVSSTNGPFVYDWSDGIDHGASGTDLVPGAYEVQVVDASGCMSDVAFEISEPGPIDFTFDGDTLICSGDQSELVAMANGGAGGFVYHWSHTNDLGGNVTVSPVEDHVYSVFAADVNGCLTDTLAFDMDVISFDVGLLAVSDDTGVCPGDSALLLGVYRGSYAPYVYNWSNGLEEGGGPYFVSPTETTNYELTITDVCDNTLAASVEVELYEIPEVVMPHGLISGCRPLQIELFDSVHTSPGYVHQWVLSNGDIYNSNPSSFILDSAGVYGVTLTVSSSEGCSASSETSMPIEVYELPIANFTASVWVTGIDNPEITFTDISDDTVITNWRIEGDEFENLDELEYTFLDTGFFAVALMAENEFGCIDTVTKWVEIEIDHDLQVPNAFTPSTPGANPYYDPNSTSNSVFYPFSDYIAEYQMSIFNRWGELIFESTEKEKGWNGTYRDKPCPQDVYVYKVELVFADGKEITKVGDITLFR